MKTEKYLMNNFCGGGSLTRLEPLTKGLSQNGITLKEYLDQEEEVSEVIIQFEYSPQTKAIFNKVYLEFYYWVRGNLEKVEEFLGLLKEVNRFS